MQASGSYDSLARFGAQTPTATLREVFRSFAVNNRATLQRENTPIPHSELFAKGKNLYFALIRHLQMCKQLFDI